MIIIETKDGDIFVNEAETIQLHHQEKKETVSILYKDASTAQIKGVINVRYIAGTPTDYISKGLSTKKLEDKIKTMEKKANRESIIRTYEIKAFRIAYFALDGLNANEHFNNVMTTRDQAMKQIELARTKMVKQLNEFDEQ